MSASIHFEQRGTATLVEMDADNATLRCNFSAPPGAPISGLIVGCNHVVQLKVRDCRRLDEAADQFVMRGRWVNLSKAARVRLTDSLAGGQVV
jgi:hypothetical protein